MKICSSKIDSVRIVILTFLLFAAFTANAGIVGADDVAQHDGQPLVFPQWTYYAEIVEHSAITIISVLAIFLLIKPYRTKTGAEKQGILWFMAGMAIIAISQLLTTLHHFLTFPFGIWNAIIHHGLLSISIAVIILAFFKLLKNKNHYRHDARS